MSHPPVGHAAPTTVERLLADAYRAIRDGAHMVDIRSDSQRAADGTIPGAHVMERNVLEWRLDPACRYRDPVLGQRETRLVPICNEGYQSSLAAATAQRFGRSAISDVIGGFCAWRAAGLPVQPGPRYTHAPGGFT